MMMMCCPGVTWYLAIIYADIHLHSPLLLHTSILKHRPSIEEGTETSQHSDSDFEDDVATANKYS